MSKNGKTKFRWVEDEEYQDNSYYDKKKGRDRRSERKLNTALKSKNYDYLLQREDDR